MNRDLSRKRGQLAHLGKDPSKTSESELVFLCFDHHDEFDSTTRQSKNLTREEIEHYRDEMLAELERQWESELRPPDQPDLDGPPFTINLSISGGQGGAGGIFGGGGGGGAGIGGGGQGGQVL